MDIPNSVAITKLIDYNTINNVSVEDLQQLFNELFMNENDNLKSKYKLKITVYNCIIYWHLLSNVYIMQIIKTSSLRTLFDTICILG